MENKILVSILTHRCQCPHGIPETGGVRGGATHIHKRKLSSEPHVKKRYKWRNHLFYTPASAINSIPSQLCYIRCILDFQFQVILELNEYLKFYLTYVILSHPEIATK
jgi:hypothetical protein